MRNKLTLFIGLLLLAFAVNAQKAIEPVKLDGVVLNSSEYAVEFDKAIAEDFEGDFLPFGWSETAIARTWGRSSNPTFQINGFSALIGQDINDPEEMLITPPLTLDGSVTTFSYNAAGVNNEFGLGSSILVFKYKLVGDATWTVLGDTIDFANGEAAQLVEHDISGLANGDYQFAFCASSTFDYLTFTGYVLIDDVNGPDISADVKTITINITNSETTDPVEGVEFAFADQVRFTNETGTALFGVLDGTYDWSGTTYGYYDISGTGVAVTADATIDLTMDPMPVVYFTVTDGMDSLEGVTIEMDAQTMLTDAGGQAMFSVANEGGDYDYTASFAGYFDVTGTATVGNIGDTLVVDLAMDEQPVAHFAVTDGTDPIEGANIAIFGENLTTDAAGMAMISLPTVDSTYEYTATAAGFFDSTATVTVGNIGDTTVVDLAMVALPRYTVTFNVTDGTSALEGATIDIAGEMLTSDASGVATIDLYDGEWPWMAMKDGYFETMDTVTVAGAAVSVDVTLIIAPAGIVYYAEDFEAYTVGDNLAVVNPTNWATWSDDPGSAEDAVIADAFALDGDNSAYISEGNDMVLKLGNQTSGKFMISYYMLMEAGNEGYYNVQQTEVPGTKWMYDVYFDGDGTGRLSIDQTDTATFVYPEAKWFLVSQVIDLDNDRASLVIDGEWVLSWMYSQDGDPGHLELGGFNFYGAAGVNYYLDNLEFKQIIFTDDFEAYTVGDLVAENSDVWETWSGAAGGGADDAAVSDDYAKSAMNSMVINDGGNDDMVLPLGNLTEGKYYVEFDVLVESGGFEGYYNFQKYEVPGTEWAFDVYFYTDGTGEVDAAGSTATFNYNQDEFNHMGHYFDLDADMAYVYVNGAMVYSWQYSLDQDGVASIAQLGGIDFYAWSDPEGDATGQSYIDDVVFGPYEFLPVEITGSTITFTVTDMGTTDPIEGATVEINGEMLTTDASGVATIELFDGSYDYAIMATDYLTIEGTAVVDGADLAIDAAMERLYHVTFNIDMTNAPIGEFDPEAHRLWITGATADGTGGIGNFDPWPNTHIPALELMDDDSDMTYTVTIIDVYPNDYEYRYVVTQTTPFVVSKFPAEGEAPLTFTVADQHITIDDAWVGVDDVSSLSDFTIYPNPTKGVVTIATQNQCEVTVMNAVGQVVLNRVVNNNETLDLSNQTQGVYFVTAKTNDATKTLRLVVE